MVYSDDLTKRPSSILHLEIWAFHVKIKAGVDLLFCRKLGLFVAYLSRFIFSWSCRWFSVGASYAVFAPQITKPDWISNLIPELNYYFIPIIVSLLFVWSVRYSPSPYYTIITVKVLVRTDHSVCSDISIHTVRQSLSVDVHQSEQTWLIRQSTCTWPYPKRAMGYARPD